MAQGKRSAANEITRLERQTTVLRLRARRMPLRAIAAEVGTSVMTVQRDVERGLVDLAETRRDAAERVRGEIDAELLYLLSKLKDKIEKGDTKAIETGNKVLATRARLHGLMTPIPGDAQTQNTFYVLNFGDDRPQHEHERVVQYAGRKG